MTVLRFQHNMEYAPMVHSKYCAIILAGVSMLFAGELKAGDHSHDEHHHGHEHGSVEAGLSNSLVYNLGEENLAYGLHVHTIYTPEESPFGLGLGYELVAGEHVHHTIGPMFCYRPADPMNICMAPGVTFEETEAAFAGHIEATYEFELHGIHLGPTVGFAYNPEDMHLSLGIHTGFEF